MTSAPNPFDVVLAGWIWIFALHRQDSTPSQSGTGGRFEGYICGFVVCSILQESKN